MFDIGASEVLLIAIVAIVVIGPKDLPLALRTAGKWIGKVRRVSNHFRSGIESMIREAEMEELEKKWKEQNARIMAEHPGAETREGALPEKDPTAPMMPSPASSGAEARAPTSKPDEPLLPLGGEETKG